MIFRGRADSIKTIVELEDRTRVVMSDFSLRRMIVFASLREILPLLSNISRKGAMMLRKAAKENPY